jgi:tRNA pseudouridine38-40 synthase
MADAARLILGQQDFASFQAAGSDRKSTVRDIRALDIIDQDEGTVCSGAGEGDWMNVRNLAIEVEADGFLYNMVRNIVGSLVEIGRGKRPPSWIAEVIAACDRKVAGPTAPPHGLFLLWVDYPKDLFGPQFVPSQADVSTHEES